MAFKTQHYDTLLQIATDLDANSDPALIKKCSDYFMANEQFDKAVNLLAVGRNVSILFPACSVVATECEGARAAVFIAFAFVRFLSLPHVSIRRGAVSLANETPR